jgi:hypothetical protein
MSVTQDLAELAGVMSEIKRLKARKDELIVKVVKLLDAADIQGQCTKTVDDVDVVLKRAPTYKVNASEYEIYKDSLSSCLNPIDIVPSYKVDRARYREALQYASAEELTKINAMIELSYPKLPSVSIAFK